MVFGLLGCLSYSAVPLELKDPTKYEVQTEDKGLTAGGVIFGPADSKKFLGEDITEHYIPVLLVVRNTTADMAMIQRADIVLNDGDGNALHAFDWTAPFRYSKKSAGEAGVGLLSSESAEDDANIANDAMAYDWKQKQFPEQFTLKQERSISGMVYFPAGAKAPMLVDIEVSNMKTQETVVLELQFGALPK